MTILELIDKVPHPLQKAISFHKVDLMKCAYTIINVKYFTCAPGIVRISFRWKKAIYSVIGTKSSVLKSLTNSL